MNTQPSTTPDSGWMGDRSRGASMGRPSKGTQADYTYEDGKLSASFEDHTRKLGKLHLAAIRLDSGGYDPGGAYWGHGGWLWEAWDDAGTVYLTGRVMAGSEERKATRDRLFSPHALPQVCNLSRYLDRETAKDAIREQVGEGVTFYR